MINMIGTHDVTHQFPRAYPKKPATHLPGASVEKVLPDTPGEICYLPPGDCFLFATA